MENKLKHILTDSQTEFDNQQLLDYLNKRLSNDERHEIEKQMNDDAFMEDAMEGLQSFSNQQHIPDQVKALNQGLQKLIQKNKARKGKRRWNDSCMN